MQDLAPSRPMTADTMRQAIRSGEFQGPTAGLVPHYAQANLVVLPKDYALEFLTFCLRNPKPCPVIEVCDAGDPVPHLTAPGADLRTDVPLYRIYQHGEMQTEVGDIRDYWSDDLVSVLLGCSFTFEWALLDHGLPIAHIDQGKNVPMYVTNQECVPAGRFHGRLVVSMRPFPSSAIPQVVSLTARFPTMHGAPVWIGNPSDLGIKDLSRPDFGDAVTLNPDDVPVFWACGVTPQSVALDAKIPFMITHSPGHMFITDRLNAEYEV